MVSEGIPTSSCWAPPDRTNWRSSSRQRRMNRSATNSSACITIAVEPFQVPIFPHGLPVLAGLCSTWISIRESDLWLSTPACHGGSAHRGPTTRRRPRRFPCSRVYFGSAQPRQTRAQQERLASLSLRVCRRCRDPGIRRSHRRACASRRRGQHSFGHATIFRQDPYRASAMCGIPLCPQFSNLLKHLCPRERQQRTDVVIVSGAQGFDIALPCRAGIAQTLPSPRKPLTAKLDRQKIGHETGVAPVAIRKWVNLHQPVMEAQRDFIGWIRVVFDPCFGVVEQLAQRYWNLQVIDSDVTLAGPEFSGPAPYVAEHLPVQVFDEFLAQQIAAATERPFLGARDVLLLGLIQLAAIGDMRGDQTAYFLRRQRGRGIVRRLEQIAHGASPKTAVGLSRGQVRQAALSSPWPSPSPSGPPAASSAPPAQGADVRRCAPGRGRWSPTACWAPAHKRECNRAPRPPAAMSPSQWCLSLPIVRAR